MRIICTGISHKTADVALREKLAFDAAGVGRALRDLIGRWEQAEFLVLSTCNRTEVYTARPVHGHPRGAQLRDWLGEINGLDLSVYGDCTYELTDAEAAGHLFKVASGLDSMVPGEPQIVAQLKAAYAAAIDADAARSLINELVETALHVAKHVRSETGIGKGKASVASAAVDIVAGQLGSLADKCILNVGAGKMNELMLRQLAKLGAGRILVANRSKENARDLARRCSGEVVAFDELPDRLGEADAILTSTAAHSPIITAEMLRRAQKCRDGRVMVIIDIAVPRDVEPCAAQLENIHLYNIDQLDEAVRRTIDWRRDQQSEAMNIVNDHVRELTESLNIRDVAPTIDALYRKMQQIADEELAHARNKLSAHDDAEADEEILRRALHRTIRRILHPAAQGLRNEAGTDAVRAHIAAVRKLFELD